jgi:hypothetical protein
VWISPALQPNSTSPTGYPAIIASATTVTRSAQSQLPPQTLVVVTADLYLYRQQPANSRIDHPPEFWGFTSTSTTTADHRHFFRNTRCEELLPYFQL